MAILVLVTIIAQVIVIFMVVFIIGILLWPVLPVPLQVLAVFKVFVLLVGMFPVTQSGRL
jgi:hypothetical protein